MHFCRKPHFYILHSYFFICWIIMLINGTVEFPMKLIICFVYDDMFIGGYLLKKYNRCCFLWNDNSIKAIVRFSKWNRIFFWQKCVFTIHYMPYAAFAYQFESHNTSYLNEYSMILSEILCLFHITQIYFCPPRRWK